MTAPPPPTPALLLRRSPVASVFRLSSPDRFEKRYRVLWPWLPLAGLLKANMPCLDARTEAANAERLLALGIPAPRPLSTSSRWRLALLPAPGLVHETTVALEPLAGTPLDALAADAGVDGATRLAIAADLGALVARMHAARIFHRDLYLCHVLWDAPARRLALLDVARAAPRRLLLRRWQVKDLAALAASAAAAGVASAEISAFIDAYGPVDGALGARIAAKAARLSRHGRKG